MSRDAWKWLFIGAVVICIPWWVGMFYLLRALWGAL